MDIVTQIQFINFLKYYIKHRDVLYLPGTTSLYTYFKEENKLFLESIQDIENIPFIIEKFFQIYNPTETVECVLSIDACSYDRPFKKTLTNVFVFYLQPINPNYKCIPLHLLPKKDGNADNDITEIAEKIVQILKNFQISVKVIATDGDDGYNLKARQTFAKYISIFESQGFDEAIKCIQDIDDIFWIGDFLHIVKLGRKQIIKSPVSVRNNLEKTFTHQSLENYLHLGSPLTDESSASFMRDSYPLKIFNFECFLELYKKNQNDESIYIFPYALWTESLLSPTLTKSTRLFFLKIAFQIFHFYYIN